jgi:hypothetical protein
MASERSGRTGNRRLMRGGDKRDGGGAREVASERSGRTGNGRLRRGGDKRDGGSDQEVASEGSGRTGNGRLRRGGDKRDGGSDQEVASEGSGRTGSRRLRRGGDKRDGLGCPAGARGVSSNSANSSAMQHQQSHIFEQGQRREKAGQQPVRPLHCRGEGCKQQLQQCKQQQRNTAATVCTPLRAGAEAGEGRASACVAIALQGRGV